MKPTDEPLRTAMIAGRIVAADDVGSGGGPHPRAGQATACLHGNATGLSNADQSTATGQLRPGRRWTAGLRWRSWSVSKTLFVVGWCAAVAGLASSDSAVKRTPAAPLAAVASRVGFDAAADAGPQAAFFHQTLLPAVAGVPSVHAATLTELPDGNQMAAWFGGSREGAKDVAIFAATWDGQTGIWGKPRRVLDADQASRELGRYIKKLGNPVLHCSRNGRIWLFYVTVSLGGWSGSSVSVKWSDDGGYSWSESDRLVTSPFMNLSTLVRCPPLELDNGELLLPAYHELITKYGELLHLSVDGQLLGKYRMGRGESLQGSLVADDAGRLLAFHRSRGKPARRVLFNESLDGGRHWTDPQPLELPNPNASVAAVRRHGGGFLMALNASETARDQLSLAVSADGQDWRIVRTLPPHPDGLESSYPTLLGGADGCYHLVYTWGRERIGHVSFNDAWLEATE